MGILRANKKKKFIILKLMTPRASYKFLNHHRNQYFVKILTINWYQCLPRDFKYRTSLTLRLLSLCLFLPLTNSASFQNSTNKQDDHLFSQKPLHFVVQGYIGATLVAQQQTPPCQAGDMSSIFGSRKPLREDNGNPLQCSCLENPMDRGTGQATVHRVTKRVRHDLVTQQQS